MKRREKRQLERPGRGKGNDSGAVSRGETAGVNRENFCRGLGFPPFLLPVAAIDGTDRPNRHFAAERNVTEI